MTSTELMELGSTFTWQQPVQYPVMRLLLIACGLVLLASCTGTQPYSQTDLNQVKRAYATITPIYDSFKVAFARDDASSMGKIYTQERRACRQVDVIDERDTIDPNVNLFQASAALDSFCNDIENTYNSWRETRGLSYDKNLPAANKGAEFIDGDANMLKMHLWLAHPSALS